MAASECDSQELNVLENIEESRTLYLFNFTFKRKMLQMRS